MRLCPIGKGAACKAVVFWFESRWTLKFFKLYKMRLLKNAIDLTKEQKVLLVKVVNRRAKMKRNNIIRKLNNFIKMFKIK
jgi:hypothetical protein